MVIGTKVLILFVQNAIHVALADTRGANIDFPLLTISFFTTALRYEGILRSPCCGSLGIFSVYLLDYLV